MKSKFKPIILLALSILSLFLLWRVFHKSADGSIVNNNVKNSSQELASQVKNIQEKIQLINNEKNYQTKTLSNEEFLEYMTDGGGELTGYFKDGQIGKISERVGLSHVVKTFEYYFWDNQLIFVYEKEEDFPYDEKTGTFDYAKLDVGFEGYYYFEKDKIIETVVTGKKRYPDDINIAKETQLFNYAKENVDLFLKQ